MFFFLWIQQQIQIGECWRYFNLKVRDFEITKEMETRVCMMNSERTGTLICAEFSFSLYECDEILLAVLLETARDKTCNWGNRLITVPTESDGNRSVRMFWGQLLLNRVPELHKTWTMAMAYPTFCLHPSQGAEGSHLTIFILKFLE